MKLLWHRYRYYPYERSLAVREVAGLLPEFKLHEVPGGLELSAECQSDLASRLTYTSRVDGETGLAETQQSCLEMTSRRSRSQQATRYSVHGLHEYKGKFNPQVARALLNMFRVMPGDRVFDPFCGSGTALVECAHLGVSGWGTDINPLAVFVSNVKLQALATPAADLEQTLDVLMNALRRPDASRQRVDESPRRRYLESWFDKEIVNTIERVRYAIQTIAATHAPVFLTIASNLLRDYSQQDPTDLRVRRRKSPLPDTPFLGSFITACEQSISRIGAAQTVLGPIAEQQARRQKGSAGMAVLSDVTDLTRAALPTPFDAAITSPPYAMALPYLDIHRLSLVWLDLVPPANLPAVESVLVGSREFRGTARSRLVAALAKNEARLPASEVDFCRRLAKALDDCDGFRRRSVPILLYRYFTGMREAMRSVRQVLRPSAPFALIVGCNHTVLGGERFEIDTPAHLGNMAVEMGWRIEEVIPLQTYQRYGYHAKNAIARETLLLLRNAPSS